MKDKKEYQVCVEKNLPFRFITIEVSQKGWLYKYTVLFLHLYNASKVEKILKGSLNPITCTFGENLYF